ncbi:MAG TPA: hypothetical protein VG734_01510 [Lacunisphaera sp.]|nr:hypothetical protein [Lacunisphaera sp.]
MSAPAHDQRSLVSALVAARPRPASLRVPPVLAVMVGAAIGVVSPAQEALERLAERLNFAAAGGRLQLRLSGSVELEGYAISDPVADLVSGDEDEFLRPRFNLYLDGQVGTRGYVFAQGRVDRGFDVYEEDPQLAARFDEYAARLELSEPGSGRLFVQAGKFATVVGNWTKRHTAWENPFITAPLPYDNLTPVWDVTPAPTADVLLAWAHVSPVGDPQAVLSDKAFRLPIVWGPAYAQGVALAGKLGQLEYAGEVKAVGLSARAERWDEGFGGAERPALSARVGWRPNPSWNLGISASRGEYLDRTEHARLPDGFDRHDYRQTVLAHDVSYAWHHWQVWGEVYAARFSIPRIAEIHTMAWYVEAKYRFTPQFSGAVRWGQQWFGDITNRAGQAIAAGRQTWRLEVAPAYRLTTQTQVKLQYSLRHDQPAAGRYTHALAGQLTVRF